MGAGLVEGAELTEGAPVGGRVLEGAWLVVGKPVGPRLGGEELDGA